MMMTILEAEVAPEQVALLEGAYREGTGQLPPGLLETYLVREAGDSSRCRIVTLWESRAALEAMRASGETPKGVQIFRAAGAEPQLTICEVMAHARS